MGEVQTVNLNGSDFVIIQKKDYDKLINCYEDYLDIIEAMEVKTKASTGKSDLIPSSVIDDIYNNNINRLTAYRKFRGLTQQQLADKSKVSKSTIAKIESGESKGSIAVFKKLAAVLKIDSDLLHD